MELPLFPLHTVLCPGVALPLHIFEERYRLMVSRCIERDEPFGVVLIRDGREVGPMTGRIADVGTTANIRQAGRYPDGRMDIVTVGDRRFRIRSLIEEREPYLLGEVTLIDEALGGTTADVERAAEHVGRRFLRYLELLQPALANGDGPEIEVEIEVEVDAPEDTVDASVDASADAGDDLDAEPREPIGSVAEIEDVASIDTSSLTPEQRRELLFTAARRLIAPSDPTALSYLLAGLIQVELPSRQGLLETPDTLGRLAGVNGLLAREIDLLSRDLKPLAIDPRSVALRRN